MTEEQNALEREKDKKQIIQSLWLGLSVGMIGIIGYNLHLPLFGWKLLYLSILIMLASFISGFFTGFLFGIPSPKKNEDLPYGLNNNLVEISDWLTKIIIGLGLVEIKRIPAYLLSLGVYIQEQTKAENSIKVFSICVVVYFSIFGLYFGYNYTRVILSLIYKGSDKALNAKEELEKTGKKLNENTLTPDNIGEKEKELEKYNSQLNKAKTEIEYTFNDWYLKGLDAYNKEEYESVITYMESAQKKEANHKKTPDSFLFIGLAYLELGLYQKAIVAFDNIINYYPGFNLINIVHSNKALVFYLLEQYEEALKEYNLIPESNLGSSSWYNKGLTLHALNKYKEALVAYETALKVDRDFIPDITRTSVDLNKDSNYWFNKGAILTELERYEDALIAYTNSSELKPNDETWVEMGKILNLIARYDQALIACEKAILLNSKNADAWFYKSEALIGMEKYPEALIASENALQLKPDDEDAWFNKGYALMYLERYADALTAFNEIIKLKKEDDPTLYNIACCYAVLGDKVNMLIYLKRAIELNETYKEEALNDKEFNNYWNDNDFKNIVS